MSECQFRTPPDLHVPCHVQYRHTCACACMLAGCACMWTGCPCMHVGGATCACMHVGEHACGRTCMWVSMYVGGLHVHAASNQCRV